MPDARAHPVAGLSVRCPEKPPPAPAGGAAQPCLLTSQLQLIDANLPMSLIGGCLTAVCLLWLVWLANPDPFAQNWLHASGQLLAWLAADGNGAFGRPAVWRMRSAAWLTGYVLASSLCWALWRHVWLHTGRRYTPQQAYRLIQAVALMFGLLWGAGCAWLFQPESGAVTLGMVCLVSGLSGGLLSGVGVRARLYWLLCFPMAIALMGTLLHHDAQVNPVLPVALLLLLITNGVFANNIERHIGSAIELHFENLALVEQLRERTQAAEQANLAKSKFLAGASHDLRQPVHALNLFLESLSTTRLDAKQETIVNHAKAASRASRELLDTLLDFSRIEAGVMQPKPAVVSMAGLLRQLEDEFGPQADNKGLVYRSRDCLDHVYSDAALLLVILRNLVANAIRYTERGGVLVAMRSRGAHRVIEVWDTGIGIEPVHHEDIFQDFHQVANQERDHRKGLGLGLAIVRRLVDALGLVLSLASRPGRGSVFSLRLPCLPCLPRAAPLAAQARAQDSQDSLGREGLGSPPQPAACEPFRRAAPARALPLQGLKVLLVDDEVLVLEGMRTLLGEWGCAVAAFKDLEGAARHVLAFDANEKPPFELLITDYRLENGVTGGDVIRAVRDALRMANPDSSFEPPSIIITGDTAPERISQAQGVGATLLHKPIDTQVLYDELAKVLALREKTLVSA